MSGWKRVGIFCTALWVVAIFAYAALRHFYEMNFYPLAFLETCMQYALNTSRCHALLAEIQQEWKRIPFDWTRPAMLAFGPPLLVWALGWSMSALTRRSSERKPDVP